ncbi:phosphatase PAP2 family protein [Nocardioides sp.]|uniref:phosphatase PAP2 family protein n=1 Tax=Nocardioides sp. TaxID=35761 RepID=UPI003D0ADE6A
MSDMSNVDAAATTADGENSRWLIRLWLLAVTFLLVALAVSDQVGVPLRDPAGVVFRNRVAISVLLFAGLCLVDWLVRRRTRTGREIALALGGLLAYHVVYAAYRNLKSWTAFRTDRDDFLARVDDRLFFGHDPAALLHDLLHTFIGEQVVAQGLAYLYESFASLVAVAVVASVVFAPRVRDGFVFIASAMWLWVLGICSYYLIPSLGPFATAPAQFALLPHTIITAKQDTLLADRAALLADPGAADGFAAISAFASLHVAFTFLILMTVRRHGRRWATALMSVVFAGTVLATIYFGWHFVIDDVVGIVLALAALKLGEKTIHPRTLRID